METYLYQASEEQVVQLRALNARLHNLQKKLIKEAINLDQALLTRLADSNDSLHDYEIEIIINFYLKESDQEYKDDKDNIITVIDEYVKKISLTDNSSEWRWNGNHNEYKGRDFGGSSLISKDHHCWWFHCLYDHNHLFVEDLLRIGIIWSDIKVYYQYVDEENDECMRDI